MAFCPDHKMYYHPEIAEDCPGCKEKQDKCQHAKLRLNLFGTTKYLGLEGDHKECVECGKLVKVETA